MRTKLTGRQQAFVTEYLKDGNGTQAAIRAGCKPNSAHVTASRWLRKVKVKTTIQEGTNRAAERAEITRAEVLSRLWQLATLPPEQTKGSVGGQVAALK